VRSRRGVERIDKKHNNEMDTACNNLVIKEEYVLTWPHTIDNI